MKTSINITFLLVSLLIGACCCSKVNHDEEYQPLGTLVLTANGLLTVQYPQGIPDNYNGEDYKKLLQEDYKRMYERLLPYKVQIKKIEKNFCVQIYDGKCLILTDWSCTASRIDCWSYNNECNPDTVKVQCDE
jgi:hypothetical protein